MIKPSEKLKAMMDFESKDNTIKYLGASTRNPREVNVFKLECIVSVDEAVNERDITFLTVGFVNNKRRLYIIQTFDDTTVIGKEMIKAITDTKKEREEECLK